MWLPENLRLSVWSALYFYWTALHLGHLLPLSFDGHFQSHVTPSSPSSHARWSIFTLGSCLLDSDGSFRPPAQHLLTKKMTSGDQPSWLAGVHLPGHGAHQTTLLDPAALAQASPFPQAPSHLQALDSGSQLGPSQPICCWRGNSPGPTGPSQRRGRVLGPSLPPSSFPKHRPAGEEQRRSLSPDSLQGHQGPSLLEPTGRRRSVRSHQRQALDPGAPAPLPQSRSGSRV